MDFSECEFCFLVGVDCRALFTCLLTVDEEDFSLWFFHDSFSKRKKYNEEKGDEEGDGEIEVYEERLLINAVIWL